MSKLSKINTLSQGGGGALKYNSPLNCERKNTFTNFCSQCFYKGINAKIELNPGSKLGFTLAEVLITLGVIGIIAALTIPNLMGAYRKRVVETELKKSYSELAQAIQRSEADNDAAIYWAWPYQYGVGQISDTEEFFQHYLAPYLKINSKVKKNNQNYLVYDSTNIEQTWLSDSSKNMSNWHELADGRAIMFNSYTTISGDLATAKKGTVGRFFILTTNRGHKKFVTGKNLFSFVLEIRGKNLVPTVNDWPTWTCNSLTTQRENFINLCKHYTGSSGVPSSAYCTYLIYCNNWKIPDDYPIKF